MMYGFSMDEVGEIFVSMLVVAIAFSLHYLFISKMEFIAMFPVILIGVGTGFVLHEIAHKFTAIKYGAHARYQAWQSGLLMTLALAVLTRGAFVFAAPGAVYIYAHGMTRRMNGIISIAGPLTNLTVGIIFALIALFLAPENSYLMVVAYFAAQINFFLGFFNMLPIPPLDGSKVFGWNILYWVALTVPLGLLAFFF